MNSGGNLAWGMQKLPALSIAFVPFIYLKGFTFKLIKNDESTGRLVSLRPA